MSRLGALIRFCGSFGGLTVNSGEPIFKTDLYVLARVIKTLKEQGGIGTKLFGVNSYSVNVMEEGV